VAGGVVVDDDRVYAAAGITHYDGTLVVALDATSGKLLAINDTSGNLSEAVQTGVSMQGELSIVDGELRFPGGGVYELARYDLRTLKCLNEPLHQLTAAYRTAFYPWYPSYDRFVSMEHTLPNGNVLCHDAAYDGNAFGNLTLETPRAAGAEARRKKDLAGEFLRRRGEEPPPSHVWTDQENRRFTSFAICGSTLLATGHIEKELARPFLVAMRTADGTTIWKQDLPASASKGGTAVDAAGRIFVTLEDGQLLCFDRTK
jgi:outer membrane protein assembly factor BamB